MNKSEPECFKVEKAAVSDEKHHGGCSVYQYCDGTTTIDFAGGRDATTLDLNMCLYILGYPPIEDIKELHEVLSEEGSLDSYYAVTVR